MKIFIYLLLSTIILSSCFWGDDNVATTGLVSQENENFSIPTPSSWVTIPQEDLVVPKSWEIVLAFRSPTPKQWYINNIVILKKENTSISAQAIIDSGIQSLEKWIKWYKLLSNREVQFADNVSGKIISYTGKYSVDTPETVFIQTARVCWNDSYYMTISLTENLASYDRYEFILQSFECK
jgi:hypothetical protein